MIIDGHAHLGGDYRDTESIISVLDRLGVDKVVLCPADSERIESMSLPDMGTRISGMELNFVVNRFIRTVSATRRRWAAIERANKRIFEMAALSEGRILQFYWVNPVNEGAAREMEEKLESWKFAGIKLHQGCHPFHVRSEIFSEIAGFATLKSLPVFIHLYSKEDVMDFIAVSGNFRANFIVGHLIGLEIFIKQRKMLSDNVFFDISCPPLVSLERIELAVSEFGAGRIIMGSDTPYGRDNLERILSRTRSLELKAEEIDMILGNNLKNILSV